MGTGTYTGIFLFFQVVSEPVSEKFGTGKKSRNRYRKKMVPKKVPVLVSKIFSTGKKYRYRYRLKFWVPSHTEMYSVHPEFNVSEAHSLYLVQVTWTWGTKSSNQTKAPF